ncbi:hypothetical protein GC101_22150 [Paenibacillus sp. LMG 31459]|uniref:GerMN domain-containing protein n=1 Tax=Paenibacillus phytohabitans TaxID=2654978 RepID=A0ABX1YKK4_9BACL|nr:hypothetical protein [Paenibacillus phytohabitans]NOU81568.1 hypothetical protein [Paenibacillus phytohabitans]
MVELIDPFGQPSEKLLSLGEEPGGAGALGSLSFSLNNKAYKALTGGTVQVNIYDEFQGMRILLGSQSYPVAYERAAPRRTEGVPEPSFPVN